MKRVEATRITTRGAPANGSEKGELKGNGVNKRNVSIYSQQSQLNKAFGSIAGRKSSQGTFTRFTSLLVCTLNTHTHTHTHIQRTD